MKDFLYFYFNCSPSGEWQRFQKQAV